MTLQHQHLTMNHPSFTVRQSSTTHLELVGNSMQLLKVQHDQHQPEISWQEQEVVREHHHSKELEVEFQQKEVMSKDRDETEMEVVQEHC
jgi:hypothetical protein